MNPVADRLRTISMAKNLNIRSALMLWYFAMQYGMLSHDERVSGYVRPGHVADRATAYSGIVCKAHAIITQRRVHSAQIKDVVYYYILLSNSHYTCDLQSSAA